MKIVLLGTEFAMNGASLLLFRWAMHLVQRGHTVSAVPASQNITAVGPLRDAYVAAGVTIEDKLYVDPQSLVVCNTLAGRAVRASRPHPLPARSGGCTKAKSGCR